MAWTLGLILASALTTPFLYRVVGAKIIWLYTVIMAGIFFYYLFFISLDPGYFLLESIPWAEDLGVSLVFRLDGLSYVFALLISFIGSGVLVYSSSYMQQYSKYGLGGFYATLLLFSGSMLGVVLSDNLVQLYVFWEITSVSSYFLIGFKFQASEVRQAATKSLLVTGAGGLSLLVAVILLGIVGQESGLVGSDAYLISNLASLDIRGHELYPWIFTFLLLAILTKSAQVPFHFWLPSAMAGPTPVSSYLHSATMVKAGIFLLARVHPFLGGTELWNITVTGFGATTMVTAAILTVVYRDLKKMLAYSTVCVLGVLVMLIGIGTEAAIKAAVVYLISHALYKAALFKVVGNIDFVTGERDIERVSGLGRVIPLTAVATLLAGLSQAGFPPLIGFYGKDLLYMTELEPDAIGVWLVVLTVLSNSLIAGAAFSILYFPFWRQDPGLIKIKQSLPLRMSIVPFVLSLTGLAFGLFPRLIDANIGSAVASSIFGESVVLVLKLWHGVTGMALLVMFLSFITITFGILVAVNLQRLMAIFHHFMAILGRYGPNAIYEKGITAAVKFSTVITLMQSASLSTYLKMILAGSIAILIYPLSRLSEAQVPSSFWTLDFIDTCLLLFGGSAALAAIYFKRHLQILAILATVGLVMILIFSVYSAPDVASTLIMVETLSILMIVMIFEKLPKKSLPASGARQLLHAAIGLAAGAVLSLYLIYSPVAMEKSVASFYIENSLPKTFGHNVVNVILVDFRSLDTLGEVLAVGIGTLAVFALLSQRRSNPIKKG